MSDDARIRTKHTELTLEQIAEALPGTGDIMASVGRCYGACWHSAHGGNWDLAAYYIRRVRGLQQLLAVLRPKYARQLEDFDREALAAVATALETRDLRAFEAAFTRGVDLANHYHIETGKSYVRWVIPARPPDDLDLGPGAK